MTQQEQELIIKDYTENGINLTKLMEKYHHTYRTIVKILDDNQINHSLTTSPHILKGKNTNIKNQRILSKEEEQQVCEIYQRTHRVIDCQNQIHAGNDVIRRCLQKYNLYISQPDAARCLPQVQRKYSVNDNFFHEQNAEMAYFLGFIAADGTIRKDSNEIKVTLVINDIDFLKLFYEKIGGRKIKTYTTAKGYECATWCATSKQIKEDLSQYNIVPNKTFIYSFPRLLKREYWIDFIRGYFDGDGSVSTAGKHAIRWQLCSASKDVLEVIIDFFYTDYNIPKPSIYSTKNNHLIYYIQYSSVSTRKIYEILYSPNCLYLPRKKEKFEQLYLLNSKK